MKKVKGKARARKSQMMKPKKLALILLLNGNASRYFCLHGSWQLIGYQNGYAR
jgi:hypothetical protein